MTAAEIEASYAVCRTIARTQARNFYWSFLALPKAKRDAMCAVYAFMRKADDLADDTAFPVPQRLQQVEGWLAEWRVAHRAALQTAPSADPVFPAVLDTMRRFSIPAELMEELVQGVTMDLTTDPRTSADLALYRDFEELYRYCYLVASVVGLVCIRIFGYKDARAEVLAERTGIAFQLTNILRDVREDAAMHRIYLPAEDMTRFGVTVRELLAQNAANPPSRSIRELLAFEAARAEEYYRAAGELLPLIDSDSRSALWVLVSIYHALLLKIQRRRYDVFSERISVSTREKMEFLLRGLWRQWFHNR